MGDPDRNQASEPSRTQPAVTYRVTGSGRAEVPAYGIADAEHQLEKELKGVDPAAGIRITQTRRTDLRQRIVEEFELSYLLTVSVVVSRDRESAEEACKAAFAAARQLVEGTRFRGVRWIRAEPNASPAEQGDQ